MLHIVSARQERMPSYTTGAALVNAESGRNGQPKTARSAASPVNRTASTGGENRAKADDSAWRCPADALLPARLRPYLHVERYHPGDVRRFRPGRSGVGGD